MNRQVRIEAYDRNEALALAKEQLSAIIGESVDDRQVEIKLVEEKKGFFGLGKKPNVYEVRLGNKGLTEREEDFLKTAAKSISIDGKFKIKLVDNGVFLKVVPAEGTGQAVKYQQIKTELDDKEIVEVDWPAVQQALESADGKWYLIAPRKPELDREADVNIEIDKDKLKAFLSFNPALGGQRLSEQDFRDRLLENGIKYGLKDEKLKQIISKGEAVQHVLIAEGLAPTPGKDAELVYHFRDKTESIGTKREDGSIDYYNLDLISNVQAGDVLISKKDPEEGKSGIAVTGEEIKPPAPKDIKIPRGKNTELKDEKTLLAKIAGQVVREEKKVSVFPVYEINGNVDLTTGNIDFFGNVLIKGDVMEGFKVRADGNVEVRGLVSAAEINALGDVIILRGFVGKDKGIIKCRGDVRTRFVENGTIITEKSIFVNEAVMHSKLTAGDSIAISDKRGLLVGGITKARTKIEANTIGSSLATATIIEVGIDPELKTKIKELKDSLKQDKDNLTKANKAVFLLDKIRKQQGKLPAAKEVMYQQFSNTIDQLNQAVEENEAKLESLHDKLDVVDNGYIAVRKKIYPGVKITIGNAQMNLHKEMKQVKYVADEGEIKRLTLGW